MKFDGNAAWKQACAAISANREVVLALAGVFFLLPSLAFSLFMPQPEPRAGLDEKELLALMQSYYVSAWPWLTGVLIVQGIGTLAVLTLFTDRSRPTVGAAIRLGVAGIVPMIVAQVILALALGFMGGVVLALASLGGAAGVAIGLVAVVVGMIYAFIKESLVAPVIAVEGVRNPLLALRRSWLLTKGNSARLAVFYLLFGLAAVVIASLTMALVGIVLALLAGPEVARFGSALVSSAVGAIASVYFATILAAAHRQLAGQSPQAEGATFE